MLLLLFSGTEQIFCYTSNPLKWACFIYLSTLFITIPWNDTSWTSYFKAITQLSHLFIVILLKGILEYVFRRISVTFPMQKFCPRWSFSGHKPVEFSPKIMIIFILFYFSRTNKACPLYQSSGGSNVSLNVAMSEEQEEDIEKQLNTDDEDLVNVDGTKVKLSSKLLKVTYLALLSLSLTKVLFSMLKKWRREAWHWRFQGMPCQVKRRRGINDQHCDYLKKHNKPANRMRTDPVVVLSTILENILNEMRDMPDVQPFLFPVNQKVLIYVTVFPVLSY